MGSPDARKQARRALATGCALLLGGAVTTAGLGQSNESAAGSPQRGRTAYLINGCGGCHDASPVGDGQPVGPQLDRESMTRNAAAAGKKLGPYVLESIVAPRAFATPGYASGVMPSYASLSKGDLDDLVSFVIGAPFTATPAGRVPRRPVETCDARASCRRTVARWQRLEALPPKALPGAKIVAAADCLSCHHYAGSGARRGAAPDLTRQAARRRSAAWLAAKLRCPNCSKPSAGMPSYGALGDANIRRIVLFLQASSGVRR